MQPKHCYNGSKMKENPDKCDLLINNNAERFQIKTCNETVTANTKIC